MSYIEPSFEIDEKGRVICQSHSKYPFFAIPNKNALQEKKMELLLTCKTCIHYQNNECFFPKSEIDKIEKERLLHDNLLCKLCGNRIDRMLTIIHKFYLKERFNIEMPLICCNCHENLKKNEFITSSKRTSTKLSFYIFYMSLIIIVNFAIGLFFGYASIMTLIGLAFWIIILIKYLKRLRLMQQGRKYYEEHFSKE